MTEPAAQDENVFAPREFPLGGEMESYLAVLARRAPGTIIFRTGAGRIFRDLLIHWPTLDDWEDEAQELCQRIADAVYPLTAALYAQAVEITATISWTPIKPPVAVDAMSTYVIFDAQSDTERHCFLSPHHPLPDADMLAVGKGVVVLCRPLHYRYHTIKDDRKKIGHPRGSMVEVTERMINDMMSQPDLVPQERRILFSVDAMFKALPTMVLHAEASRSANLARQSPRLAPRATPPIRTVTSLSALPPPVRAIEHRLLAYVTDRTLSPALRVGLRQIAQALRAQYPQAMIEEAARHETTPPSLRPSAAAVPAARPTPQPAPHTQPAPVAPRPAFAQTPPRQDIRAPGPVVPRATPHPSVPMSAPVSVRPSVVLSPAQRPATPVRNPAPAARPQPAAPQQRAQPSSPAPRAEPSRAEPRQPEPQRQSEQRRAEPQRAEQRQPEPQRPGQRQPEPQRTETRRSEPQPRQEERRPASEPSAPRQRANEQPQTAPRYRERDVAPRPALPLPAAAHPMNEPEIRPPGFYDRLRKPLPKSAPILTPVFERGLMTQAMRLKLDKVVVPPQAAIQKPRPHYILDTPTPFPMPHSPVLRTRK